MPPLPLRRDEVERVLARLDAATGLPPRAYHDASVFAFERAAIFDRTWRCVGRQSDVDQPGAWLRAPITDAGVLVVRGPDLELRALHNVCRHRGSVLVDETSGRGTCFRCPYHGWTYELTGALRERPRGELAPGTDAASLALPAARVDTWQGFVFVALDAAPARLASALGTPPDRLARAGLAHLLLGRRVQYAVRANWKLVVENFQESLHFPDVHASLERVTPAERAATVISEPPWLCGTMAIAGDADTVSLDGALHGRPAIAGASDDERRVVFDALLFPGLMLSLQPDYLLAYRLSPEAPDLTRVIADIYFHPAAFAGDLDADDVFGFWDRVNAEDRRACERQQLGIASPAAGPAHYTMLEDGVHAFDRLVAGHYLDALSGDAA